MDNYIWAVKDNNCIPLPPHHILRRNIDYIFLGRTWWPVKESAGKTVWEAQSIGYLYACCAVSDWPEELGPIPQKHSYTNDLHKEIKRLNDEIEKLRLCCCNQSCDVPKVGEWWYNEKTNTTIYIHGPKINCPEKIITENFYGIIEEMKVADIQSKFKLNKKCEGF